MHGNFHSIISLSLFLGDGVCLTTQSCNEVHSKVLQAKFPTSPHCFCFMVSLLTGQEEKNQKNMTACSLCAVRLLPARVMAASKSVKHPLERTVCEAPCASCYELLCPDTLALGLPRMNKNFVYLLHKWKRCWGSCAFPVLSSPKRINPVCNCQPKDT